MMDNLLPKIKTIRIMLRDMSEQQEAVFRMAFKMHNTCLLYTSPSPRDPKTSRMPSSA